MITFSTTQTFYFHVKNFTSVYRQNKDNNNFGIMSTFLPSAIYCDSNLCILFIIYIDNIFWIIDFRNLFKLLAASFNTFSLAVIDLELNFFTM